jgi:hypothetical protein
VDDPDKGLLNIHPREMNHRQVEVSSGIGSSERSRSYWHAVMSSFDFVFLNNGFEAFLYIDNVVGRRLKRT